MIRFACPGCAAAYTVSDDRAGKSGKCAKCNSQFVIPDAAAGSTPAPPPPPPSAPAPTDYPESAPPVTVRPCPGCGTRMSVLPGDVGKTIRCVNCAAVFQAAADGQTVPPPPPPHAPLPAPVPMPMPYYPPPQPRRAEEDVDDDRPRKRKRRKADLDFDDEDDEPIRRRPRRGRTTHITRIGVLKFALTSAMVNFVLALATMLLYGLFLLLSFTCLAAMVSNSSSGYSSGSSGGGNPFGGLAVVGGAGVIGWFVTTLVAVVCGFIGGFIYGLIFALAYNAAAKMTGGVEVEMQ